MAKTSRPSSFTVIYSHFYFADARGSSAARLCTIDEETLFQTPQVRVALGLQAKKGFFIPALGFEETLPRSNQQNDILIVVWQVEPSAVYAFKPTGSERCQFS